MNSFISTAIYNFMDKVRNEMGKDFSEKLDAELRKR